MKRFLIVLLGSIILGISISSCAHTKKDCQGTRHVKLKNGIYL